MKKSALLRNVAAGTGVPYSTVKRVMDATLDQIVDRLQHGDRVVLSGFGTFALRPYKARTWVNPQTSTPVDIPAALRPGFVTSAALKRRLATGPIPETPSADGTADAAGPVRRRRARAQAEAGTGDSKPRRARRQASA